MKIANKISLSFLGVSMLLACTAAPTFYFIASNSLKNEIEGHLETFVQAKKEHVMTYLEMLRISVKQLSKSVVLENLLKAERENSPNIQKEFEIAMLHLKRTKEANPAIYEFLLLDAAGRVVVSTDQKSIGVDKSNDAFFLGGQKEDHIKDAYYSQSMQENLIAVSCPFLDSRTGELIGVLAARVKLYELDNIMTKGVSLGRTDEVYLVNKYGYMITPSRFLKGTFLKQKIDTINFSNCMLDRYAVKKNNAHSLRHGVIIFRDYRGRTVLGAHAYIPEMQWCLLAEVDRKEAFAPLAVLWIILLIVLIIVPLAALVLGTVLSVFIIRPIRRLHKGAEIIGSGNLDYRVGTDARDEIGQLSRAFDLMSENLKRTTISIDRLNKEIVERQNSEARLKEKMKELEIFNKVAVDREIRMIELKNEIKELKARPGEKG